MEKPTKKKLRQMLTTFTVQYKIAHPLVTIQKNLDPKIKSFLSSEGMQLLNNEINNIIERQRMSMQDKNKLVEEEDFRLMKKNLKIYGKNRKQYRVQKIIKIGQQAAPQPLQNIVKVHENKFTIAKEHNVRLSQKIDAIIQQQNIISMKKAKRQHLQSKLQPPLIRQLKRFRSTHTIGGTQCHSQHHTKKSKGQSLWTQRTTIGGFEVFRGEERLMEKYRRDKEGKQVMGGRFNILRQRNSVEEGSLGKEGWEKGWGEEMRYFMGRANCRRRLKRKAIEYG